LIHTPLLFPQLMTHTGLSGLSVIFSIVMFVLGTLAANNFKSDQVSERQEFILETSATLFYVM